MGSIRRAGGATDAVLSALRPSHGPNFPAVATAAKEPTIAIGFQPRHDDAFGHIDPFQYFAALRIDAAQVALVAFPGAVPKFAIDPGDASDKALGFYGTQDDTGFRVDLMNLAIAILADPERAFRPGEAGVATAARRGIVASTLPVCGSTF